MAKFLLFCVLLTSLYCSIQALSYVPPTGWGNWSPWSSCSYCVQTRRRQCLVSYCPGSTTETRKCCDKPPCTPAYWSNWGKWDYSPCPCGKRFRTRNCVIDYRCTNPNDKRCEGTNKQTKKCTGKYKIPQWNQWSRWSSCDKTCGGGKEVRTRTCNSCGRSSNCPGSGRQERSCNTQPCCSPRWSVWSGWSSCSKYGSQCQQVRTRSCRKCNQPSSGCPGSSRNTRLCSGSDWSSWGAWSSCNSNCQRVSTRSCRTKCGSPSNACYGPNSRTEACTSCCTPKWNQWSSWSSCDKTCGGGKQVRTRTCNTCGRSYICPGSGKQERSCNTQPCCSPLWSVWGGWSSCSKYGSQCQQVRTRSCRKCNQPSSGCPGSSRNTRLCSGSYWSGWGAWSSCNSYCQRVSTRSCRTKCDTSSSACYGSNRRTQACTSCCTPSWGPWSAYGSCQGCKSYGKKYRTRKCLLPPGCGYRPLNCPGSNSMSASCYGTNCGYG